MAKAVVLSLLILVAVHSVDAQRLPAQVKKYLDGNFRGWKLAGECSPKANDNKRVLVGDFDGNGRRDYAVKFTRRNQGFIMAFLGSSKRYKPFYLHIYSADDARFSDLMLFEKGEKYEMGLSGKLKHDAPADFRCESDVGGIHVYRNGKFIGY